MTYTVSTRAVDLVTEFEGSKPRLVAELCEGGRYELGWGSTYHLDGRPVEAGETCTLEYAKQLRAHALQKELAPVLKEIRVPLRQNEVDALAAFAYNVGGGAAAKSVRQQSLSAINKGRYKDAAEAFAQWTGAESDGPSPREIANGYKIDAPYRKFKGVNRWVPQEYVTVEAQIKDVVAKIDRLQAEVHQAAEEDVTAIMADLNATVETEKELREKLASIKPCKYFRRLLGLLRRNHAQGCLFLGYDHREATKPGALSMRTKLEWDATRGRWQDVIVEQTPFASTLAVASKYPLFPPMPTIAQQPDPPKAPEPVIAVKAEPLPELKPAVDPSLPPKKIEESKTGKAVNRASRGRETVAVSTIGTVLAGLATQIEIIGRSLESIGTDTLIRIALFGFICLAAMGAYMWWSGRNEAYHRRLETQDPKY